MEDSILRNKKFQLFIRFVTAMSFALFTIYQIILVVKIEENRIGRLIGIGIFLLITVASFLGFSDKYGVWLAHAILFVGGLIVLFVMRILNLTTVFGDMSSPGSVLNGTVYILSQVGALVLIAGYVALRADLESRPMKILETVLMTVAIVIFAACFIIDCVLALKYGVNIEGPLMPYLLSRLLFRLGFIGTAVSFLLPVPKRESEVRAGRFLYSEDDEDEVDLII